MCKNKKNVLCKLIMNVCKKMLYCPGSGQEMLSAFGVTMECHNSGLKPQPCQKFLLSFILSIKNFGFETSNPLEFPITFCVCVCGGGGGGGGEPHVVQNMISSAKKVRFLGC